MAILADQPELQSLAQLASIPASQMAAAFNNPERFFEFLTLEEVDRMKAACERMALLQNQIIEAMAIYTAVARVLLENKEA